MVHMVQHSTCPPECHRPRETQAIHEFMTTRAALVHQPSCVVLSNAPAQRVKDNLSLETRRTVSSLLIGAFECFSLSLGNERTLN